MGRGREYAEQSQQDPFAACIADIPELVSFNKSPTQPIHSLREWDGDLEKEYTGSNNNEGGWDVGVRPIKHLDDSLLKSLRHHAAFAPSGQQNIAEVEGLPTLCELVAYVFTLTNHI